MENEFLFPLISTIHLKNHQGIETCKFPFVTLNSIQYLLSQSKGSKQGGYQTFRDPKGSFARVFLLRVLKHSILETKMTLEIQAKN